MNLNFDIKAWWHTLIDHLFSHPQAADFAHPAIAAAAAAMQPAPPPVVASAPGGAPTPPAFPWAAYAGQTDRVAFMAFAMKTGGNPQDADKAAAYAAGVVKTEVPTPGQGGAQEDRWADTFPWTSAGGDPLYFKGDSTKNIVPPAGYTGTVHVDFGETPAAGPVPAKLSLNGQIFEGPTVRDAFLDIPVSGPTQLHAVAMDANGNVDPNAGGSLVLHHT